MRNLVIKRFSLSRCVVVAGLAVIASAASNASVMDPREFIDSSLKIPDGGSKTVGGLLPCASPSPRRCSRTPTIPTST